MLPILIIDDSPADLEILQDHLRDGGFTHVQTAVGGAAGIAALNDADTSSDAPGVVVVDIRMPPPDGHEVLARIKAMNAGCRPLALAVTGDSSQAARIAALQAGASDFITKPFDSVELLLRVRNLAETKRQERELREALTYQQLANEYRMLADNAVDVVTHIRGDEIAWISPSVEAVFGWPVDKWIGTGFGPRIHPDDLDAVVTALQGVAHDQSFITRCRVETAHDGYRWVEAYGKLYIDAQGNPDGIITAARVIDDQVEAERQRAEAEKRYQLLFESAPDAVIIVGPDGYITGANAQTDQMFGYPREELIGTQVDMLVPQRFRAAHAAHRTGFITDPTVRPMGEGQELWGLRRDGTEFPVSISLSPLRVGPNSEVLAAIRDVTQQRETERQREADRQRAVAAETRFHLLADNAVDVVAHVRNREVVWISPSAEAAFGWPAEAWIGTDFSPRFCPNDPEAAAAVAEKIARGEPFSARVRSETAGGDYRWVEARGKPYIDAQGSADGMIVSIRVVDEQVVAEQQLKTEKERFEAVVANAPPAISVRDLQHRYTLVNETFCQLFGQQSVGDVIGRADDEILPADVLERSRQADALLLAGDSSSDEESIKRGSENVLLMTQRFPLRNAEGAITELVTIRTDITSRRKAEQEAAERALWQDRIWAAIGDGRLLVYSQPIVDITTRDTVGEELLVRLRDAETDEVLPPGAFLPQCEQHGLISVIDRYMVGWAVDLAHSGRKVSVNITGQTIGDRKAMDEILDALTTAGPDAAGRINFEITETTAIGSPETAKTFSHSMRALGCRVALDDFGTGYGTFTELRHLELDTLKIDLSFVQNMLANRDDERAVNTIIFVAQTYGLTTVAEGVESQEVLDRLAELGVDRAQGYYFDKPQPIVW